MLDPLTIATSCVSLINGITSLTMHITIFVNDVRGARKDMDLISRELTSLSLCLGALRTDCQSHRVDYPEASRKGIERALLNTDVLTQQIKDLLQTLSLGKLGRRIQWTMQSKDTVDKLRSSLETQNSTIRLLCNKDAEVLRRDAVDIKQLIRQEADALRAEIAALKHGKILSTELQEFLRLSEDYPNRAADPFITLDQSDAGLGESLTEVFSWPPLILTPGSSVEPVEIPQGPEQDQRAGPMCPSCGHRIVSNSLPVELQPMKPLPKTSALREVPRIPSRVFDEVAPAADNSITKTTVKCGEHAFSTTFPKDAELSAVSGWLWPLLRRAEEDRVFSVDEIKQAGDIRLSLNGSEVIVYPGEKLSDLARIYGFGGVLVLDAVCKPRAFPDFREQIKLSPMARIPVYPFGKSQQMTLQLINENLARWHAPIA